MQNLHPAAWRADQLLAEIEELKETVAHVQHNAKSAHRACRSYYASMLMSDRAAIFAEVIVELLRNHISETPYPAEQELHQMMAEHFEDDVGFNEKIWKQALDAYHIIVTDSSHVDALRAENAALKAENAALRAENEGIETAIALYNQRR